MKGVYFVGDSSAPSPRFRIQSGRAGRIVHAQGLDLAAEQTHGRATPARGAGIASGAGIFRAIAGPVTGQIPQYPAIVSRLPRPWAAAGARTIPAPGRNDLLQIDMLPDRLPVRLRVL
ncbi:MAG: hypothetical protein ACK4TB_07905 [Gemmobacter sp.]